MYTHIYIHRLSSASRLPSRDRPPLLGKRPGSELFVTYYTLYGDFTIIFTQL